MEKQEIVIVGGGLAGLVAAILLQKNGRPVLVVEKKNYPFHRVCGEYLSNEVKPFLQKEGLYPVALGPAIITRFRLTSQRGKSMEMPLDLGGFGISRYALDRFLYQKALDTGVSFLLQNQVLDLHFHEKEDEFSLQLSDGKKLLAKTVLGAFGKRSKLDQAMGRSFIKKRSPYIGVKYHVQGEFERDLVALHNFEGGYCGINAIENNTFNLCYLGSKAQLKTHGNISEMEERILCKNPFLRHIFKEGTFLFEKPEVINEVDFSVKSPVENHVLMIGDAAGLITPLCGNGMAIAIHSGKLAAEAVLQNRNRGLTEKQYAGKWSVHFRQRLRIGRITQKLFGSGSLSEFAIGLVKKSPYLARAIIAQTHGKVF